MVESNNDQFCFATATQLIPLELQESSIFLVPVTCIPIKDPKQIPTLLAYFSKHAPLTNQKISGELGNKLTPKLLGHLYGKFRSKSNTETINLTHLKRIRNKNNEIAMVVGTSETCDGLEHLENSFEIEVPSRMIYQRELFDKYLQICGWPMNFNTQPSGFQYINQHELKLPKAIFQK